MLSYEYMKKCISMGRTDTRYLEFSGEFLALIDSDLGSVKRNNVVEHKLPRACVVKLIDCVEIRC